METTSLKLENVCQHGFWIGQGAAPCPFCHPECYANGTHGTIAPLITVNLNTLLDLDKAARIAALESALATERAARISAELRLADYGRGCRCDGCARSGQAECPRRQGEIAALEAATTNPAPVSSSLVIGEDAGRVERVAKWMRHDAFDFPGPERDFDVEWEELDEGEREAWRRDARAVLAAADGEVKP